MTETELADLYGRSGEAAAPAYERVKQLITSGIAAGHWRSGDRLPSEHELVAALGLSRMTVNRAFRELATSGAVVRLIGVGTFVAPTKTTIPVLQVRNIADEIQLHGHRHRSDVIFARREPTTAVNAAFAGAFPGPVFHSLVMHHADDIPIQLEDRYVDPVRAPKYLEQDFTALTPHTYLSAVAPLTRGHHVVEAVTGTDEECRLLRVEPAEPLLLIRRRTWSSDGLVSAVRLLHPGSRNRLEGEFTAD